MMPIVSTHTLSACRPSHVWSAPRSPPPPPLSLSRGQARRCRSSPVWTGAQTSRSPSRRIHTQRVGTHSRGTQSVCAPQQGDPPPPLRCVLRDERGYGTREAKELLHARGSRRTASANARSDTCRSTERPWGSLGIWCVQQDKEKMSTINVWSLWHTLPEKRVVVI